MSVFQKIYQKELIAIIRNKVLYLQKIRESSMWCFMKNVHDTKATKS